MSRGRSLDIGERSSMFQLHERDTEMHKHALKVIAAALLLCFSLPSMAAITLDGHSTAQSASTTSYAFTINSVPAGDTIILGVFSGSAAGVTIGATDNVDSGTYNVDKTENLATDGDTTAILSKYSSAGGNITVTVTSSSAGSMYIGYAYVAGLATSNATDQTAGANATSTSPSSGNTATTTTANEFVFSFLGLSGANSETITGAASTTILDTITNSGSGFKQAADGYQIVSATGAYAGQYGLTVSEEWAALVATYKGASSGGACTHEGDTSSGTFAIPNGTSGSYLLCNGQIGTPDCSTIKYWQPQGGYCRVN